MKARTTCCKALIEVGKGARAKLKGVEYLVCNDGCRKMLESATSQQMKMMLE